MTEWEQIPDIDRVITRAKSAVERTFLAEIRGRSRDIHRKLMEISAKIDGKV